MDVDVGGFLNQNLTYDYHDDYENPEDLLEASNAVWILAVYPVVLLVGLLGNALLMAVLGLKKEPWRVSDIFILNLGIADLLLLLMLPLWAVQAAHDSGWVFGKVLCKISGAVFNINFYCGIYLLLCICLDWCLSVSQTTRLCFYQKPLFAHVTCMIVWFFSLLLTIPDWVFLVEVKEEAKGKTQCIHKFSDDQKLWSRLRHHVLGCFLPTATVIICCLRVLLQHRSKVTQKQRAVILPLVVVFFICWMPYNITLLVDTSKNPKDLSGNTQDALKTALMVTTVLGCVHACLRPLLYLGLCLNFRQQSLNVLRCAQQECKSSLWELGVGKEVLPHQSQELQSISQVQSASCSRINMVSGDSNVI